MRYTLLLHYEEHDTASLGDEAMAEGQAAFASYAATLHAAGVLVAAEVLQPSTASTTVGMRDGALQVQDGPFADTKEQLGGTVVIDVPDLDAAIAIAREAPPVHWGTVEIRPGAVFAVDGVWVANA
ncbi:YciI family protein [Agrococcus sp. 1P02AA]|uniref:YciI family protein n=1 Tax=Agrococcus sp. 1P02AA TaxID=3132259 RepID=UPI0039A6D0A2